MLHELLNESFIEFIERTYSKDNKYIKWTSFYHSQFQDSGPKDFERTVLNEVKQTTRETPLNTNYSW